MMLLDWFGSESVTENYDWLLNQDAEWVLDGKEGDPNLNAQTQANDTQRSEIDGETDAVDGPTSVLSARLMSPTGWPSADSQELMENPLGTGSLGWVELPGTARHDAIFMLSATRLGIGLNSPADSEQAHQSPVASSESASLSGAVAKGSSDDSQSWYELDDIQNLDAIGDPDHGIITVELLIRPNVTIKAGWSEAFCEVVVAALESSKHGAEAVGAEVVGVDGSAASDPGGAVLELEDVTYLGGFPGQGRKRRHCSATLSHDGVTVSGPSGLNIGLAWGTVKSVDVQNSDEARFRTDTKIHRDSSALVFECVDSVVTFEARDCPTVALRGALETLLADLDIPLR